MNEENSKEMGKIKKVKKHIREHRKIYTVAAIAAAVGIVIGAIGTFAVLVANGTAISNDEIRELERAEFSGIINQYLVNKNRNSNITFKTISIYGNNIGRPGNRVVDLDTMKEYATQHLAAISAEVSDNAMSRHLNGDYPDLNGRRFARVIDAE